MKTIFICSWKVVTSLLNQRNSPFEIVWKLIGISKLTQF